MGYQVPDSLRLSQDSILAMEESQSNLAHLNLRLGNLDAADCIVRLGLERFEDKGASSEVWSLRLLWAELIRLRGCAEEALDYLSSMEILFPPEAGDFPSLAGLRMHCGFFLGLLGRFIPAHTSLSEAERIACDSGQLELQCEVHQRSAVLFYFQED